MDERMRQILDSDTDESDFEGFNESDIDIADDSGESSSSESDSDDEGPVNAEWTSDFSPFRVHDFTGHSGPNLPDDFDVNTASPLDYFWLMFSAQMFDLMARFTNRYARFRMNAANKEDDRWTKTTPLELRAFVGMNIFMGITTVPQTNMFWSKERCIGNQVIADVMTANRFQKVSQYFHVSDRVAEPVRGSPNYDRLFKIRPILDHVSENFLVRYDLGRNVAVDEAMVRYTGKLSFRQFMPSKPIKRGMKIWMACDGESAYLSRFQVYLGRTGNLPEHGLGHGVVTTLTDNLHHSHRCIFFDNFFTGVQLLEDLFSNGLYGCGTVRINRKGFPADLKKPRTIPQRGDFETRQKGASNLIATAWRDKRIVHHLSTADCPTDIRDAQRRVGATLLHVHQPATVHSYNRYMGGVDQHDQLRMKYEVGRNSKKWWRYLFWFVINCAIVNAFIIYKAVSRRQHSKKRYTHLDFRIELAKDLIAGYTTRKRRISEVNNPGLVEAANVNGHIHGKLSGPKGRCRYHLKMLNTRKETVYGCQSCRVHLCKDGCHGRFHNL